MPNKFKTKIALEFHEEIVKDKFHRYKSWEHCYNAFNKKADTDFLSLHLAFYLASWGMYRGSSGLLQKDYKIHEGAIHILLKKEYEKLHCNASIKVSINNIELIINLKEELKSYYKKIPYIRNENNKFISDTDTLISKIILGTLACVPAYDKYFIEGLKNEKFEDTKFNESSLQYLFAFIKDNEKEIENCQKKINTKEIYYPVMKIIDMYFWEIGFEEELKNKNNKSKKII